MIKLKIKSRKKRKFVDYASFYSDKKFVLIFNAFPPIIIFFIFFRYLNFHILKFYQKFSETLI